MVDLTRHNTTQHGCSTWSPVDPARPSDDTFTAGIRAATLDLFRGYSNAIRDKLEDATAVLDGLPRGTARTHGHGRVPTPGPARTTRPPRPQHDPLFRIRNALGAGADARQISRIEGVPQAGDPDFEVTVAWRCYQQLRSALTSRCEGDGATVLRAGA
jgi:transposase